MEAAGVIGRYAIGGALPTLGPIYDYLLPRGYQALGQHIEMEGWLV